MPIPIQLGEPLKLEKIRMISKYYNDGIPVSHEAVEESMLQCREEVLVELVKASQKIDNEITSKVMTPEPRRLGVNNA